MENIVINLYFVAGLLVCLELATGTFYLLVLALSALVAGIGSTFGLSFIGQLFVFSFFGVGGSLLAYMANKKKHAKEVAARNGAANNNMLIDSGVQIYVNQAELDAMGGSGQGCISYRGSNWRFKLDSNVEAKEGQFVIRNIDRNVLILGHV